jgi:hypothetical protein
LSHVLGIKIARFPFFLDFLKYGQHFSYPHGASSTKWKIWEKFFFFQIFSKKSKISKFFSFFLHVFLFTKAMVVVELRKWPGYQKCLKIFKVLNFLVLTQNFHFTSACS